MTDKIDMPDKCLGNITQKQYEDLKEYLCEIVENDNTFHIGQGYEGKPAQLIKCRVCGSIEFNIGIGHYFTAIKCKNCKWEECIHEG